MGKKKAVKKTKELSVAIAESSSLDAAEGQQQQPLTARKRGRPRKIIAESTAEVEEVKEEDKNPAQEEEEGSHGVEAADFSKKVKTSYEKAEQEEATTSSSSKKQVSAAAPRSRARRKSKPRKSS